MQSMFVVHRCASTIRITNTERSIYTQRRLASDNLIIALVYLRVSVESIVSCQSLNSDCRSHRMKKIASVTTAIDQLFAIERRRSIWIII